MATKTLTLLNDQVNITTISSGTINGVAASFVGLALDAGLGTDTLYIGDNYANSMNFLISASGAGVITISSASGASSGTFSNFEKMQFANGVTINLGTAAADTITGTAFNDKILYGLAGNDTINGGLGADTMYGGLGDDTYFVDNSGDVVSEAAGQGTDTVKSTINYTLGANVENLTLLIGATNGTGNAANNVITGNTGVNILKGLGGDDTLIGGAGADMLDGGVNTAIGDTASYVGSTAGVTVNLALTTKQLGAGDAAGDVLVGIENVIGSALADTLIGNAGANVITGGAGRDLMTGGAGADTFKFLAVTDTTKVAATHDIIKDFVHAVDKINLVGIDANANVALDQAFTFLATKGAAFTGVAGQLHFVASGANTIVEGDINGDKVADFQIELTGNIPLTAVDFVL